MDRRHLVLPDPSTKRFQTRARDSGSPRRGRGDVPVGGPAAAEGRAVLGPGAAGSGQPTGLSGETVGSKPRVTAGWEEPFHLPSARDLPVPYAAEQLLNGAARGRGGDVSELSRRCHRAPGEMEVRKHLTPCPAHTQRLCLPAARSPARLLAAVCGNGDAQPAPRLL